MAKLPTRSPTDEDLPIGRLSAMGLELEEIAEDDEVQLSALIELAEDRGRPPSHYLVAIPLATELRVGPAAPVTVKICAGNCQRWGARDIIDRVVDRIVRGPGGADAGKIAIAPMQCLDRCDLAPACELHGEHGQLVIAPATKAALDEALDALAR